MGAPEADVRSKLCRQREHETKLWHAFKPGWDSLLVYELVDLLDFCAAYHDIDTNTMLLVYARVILGNPS